MDMLEHELRYKTPYGGYVCNCTRYFDTENELNKHIEKRKGEFVQC